MLYSSGEESEHQIKSRGERLGVGAAPLYLLAETCLERILEEIARVKPALVIVDSIQTVFSLKFQSAPGSIGQVREAATQLLFAAKGQNVPTFLVGHVTKDGSLAGPKALEHVVDTVLYFEGERHHSHRVVRAVKNRFGAISELGVFEMTAPGCKPVPNPSEMFLAERPTNAPGSAVLCAVEGSRPMLVEVQALVSSSSYGNARRMASGLDQQRLSLLLAVLEKRAGLNLMGDDVFVNIAGGMTVDEPASDLGVLAAIASSVRIASFRRRPRCSAKSAWPARSADRQARCASARRRKWDSRRCVMPEANIDPAADRGDGASWSASRRWARRSTRCCIPSLSGRRASSRRCLTSHADAVVRPGLQALRRSLQSAVVLVPEERSMAWFALRACLFVAAVAYAAAVLRPLALRSASMSRFALVLAAARRGVREPAARDRGHRVLGALIGCAIGLGLARTIGAGLFWADSGDRRVEFLHSFILLVLPYLGLVLGGKQRRVAGAAAAGRPVPRGGPARATRFSTPASSSTAGSPTSARRASSTARSSSRSSC